MKSSTYTAVTANGDSAVLDMGSSAAYFVDLFIPFIANAAPEHDSGDLTFKYSVDGTNYKAVPGMTVADNENGYKGRFLVWGNRLKYTAASLSGSAATVAPQVSYKAASMVEVKADWSSLSDAGVLDGDTGSENFTFGRAPGMLLLDMEAGTWDSVSMVIQGTLDGTNWFDLDGVRATVNDQYLVFNNPAGLTQFRVEWTGGGLSAATMAIVVVGLTNVDGVNIFANADVLVDAADLLVTSGDGTAAADATLVNVTATWDATGLGIYNDNNITIIEEINKLKVLTDRIVLSMQASGQLPTGNGLEA